MQRIQVIQAESVPPPNGHYSQAVVHKEIIYVSGQLGRGPGMSDQEAGDATTQTRRALAAISAILHSAGSDLSHVLKATLFIPDIELWSTINVAYQGVLGKHRPARSVVPTKTLHFGALVEIEVTAALAAPTLQHGTSRVT
jgi:2-iminobutanoate/2-iminopropanoate deaminase